MPYWLESDTFAVDPVWEVLAGGSADLVDQLQAAYCRLKASSAQVMSDGYLTERMALLQCRGRKKLLGLLTGAVLDQPPLLHRQGDECECLGEHWIPGYAYRIHAFSKRNPSRKEYNRNRAQKADLRDARLKALVYTRDGGCCRYCGSGPLSPKAGRAKDPRKRIHYDHVDPDRPAGLHGENFVLSCKRCNEHKGHRLPDEADMVLLPAPTPEQAARMRARDLTLHDLPAPGEAAPAADNAPADHAPIGGESTTDHDRDQKPVTDRTTDPPVERNRDPYAEPAPPVYPPAPRTTAPPTTDRPPGGSGLGRGGDLPATGNPQPRPTPWSDQPARTPENPDIYHRRSRPPAPPTDPPYVWPAGAVPAARPDRPTAPPEESP
ncbi:HNH endonuclease [Micromonospora chalcea]|uniref:HNH endonuclease n=1 Tax=Micromonospora chalcea TaxID=1874 RepID=UPI0021A3AF60|nr:HNH endonuclease [Micromonospora chalcea]MCT2276331.1 HNH endonuclease [Micromonospora chalcea]